MVKSTKILMASAATVMFIGCGAGDTVDELTGSKSRNDVSSTSTVTLNMANDKSSFTISVQGSPSLTSSHVGTSFQLTDNNDHKLLDEYLGYKGDITTTCQQESATSTTITYECVSKNNYTTIVLQPVHSDT